MYIDVILTLLFVWALYSGWRTGAIKQLFSAVGFVAGLAVASLCYMWLGDYLGMTGSRLNMVLNVVAFVILWIIVPIGLGFVANVLTKTFDRLHIGWPNRVAGAVVSLAKFVVLFSCIFNVMEVLGMIGPGKTAQSFWYKPVASIVAKAVEGHRIAPAQDDEAAPDTVWIDMHPKK